MKLVFKSDEFLKKFNSIKDKKKRFKWVSDLSRELDDICRHFTNEQYADLYKKYKLELLNDIILKQTYIPNENQRIKNSPFKYFILYLEQIILPFVNSKKIRLELELFYIERKQLIKKGILSEDEKFPSYDFYYESIKSYSDNVFSELSDKIEYFEYVLLQWDKLYKGREAYITFNHSISTVKDVDNLRRDLEFLKLKYKHYIDKNLLKIQNKKSNKTSNESTKKNEINKKRINKSDINASIPKSQNQRKDIKNLSNKEKPQWLASRNKLEALLEELQLKQFIDDILDDDNWEKKYLSCFVNAKRITFYNDIPMYINWKTEISDLGLLVSNLNSKGLKPCLNSYRYLNKISKVFLFRGSPINKDSLTSAVSMAKKGKVYNDVINEIILKVRQTK